MDREELRKRVRLLVGEGEVHYLPSKRTVEAIIEQLIAEGRIPPREKWKEIKDSEVPHGESE
jgi:hypothetical protein